MSRCHNSSPDHVNGFIDLDGIPYLLAEYLDRNTFQQMDRSMIRSGIFVDQGDAMRAIIDIHIDDIGKRGSNGYPAIVGNTTKHRNFLSMIKRHSEYFNHQLPVLRRGIVVRVNYQLEHYSTQQVIRTMVEDLRISDRNYFLDINPRNIDDNAIITNFSGSMVSTINQFTHGREKMALRITNIQLLYEYTKDTPKIPHVRQTLNNPEYQYYPGLDGARNEYEYHMQHQHHQFIDGQNELHMPGKVEPPSWRGFNRFYHFNENGSNVVLHNDEIYDPMTQVGLIPCGSCKVNQCFIINPGHRLVFKLSIWKNDLTVVHDTSAIADALSAPMHYHDHHNPRHDHDIDLTHDVCHKHHIDDMQDRKIDYILEMIEKLKDDSKHQQKPEPPLPPESCECNHDDINNRLDYLQALIEQALGIEKPVDPTPPDDNDDGCCCDHDLITVDDIEKMLNSIKNKNKEEGE